MSLIRPPNTQYLAAKEMGEVRRLLDCLNGLKLTAPNDVTLYDTNGEMLGVLKIVDHEQGWALWYPEPTEEASQ